MTQQQQRCDNCAHLTCLFQGESRLPMYHDKYTCWVDPRSEPGKAFIDTFLEGHDDQQIADRHRAKVSALRANIMTVGGKYNWVCQRERLIYLGKKGSWHQFALVECPEKVWCEVLTSGLHMIEETVEVK